MNLDTNKDVYLLKYIKSKDNGLTWSSPKDITKEIGKLDLNSKDYITIDPRFFRAEELKYLRGDSSKLRETLGWEPEFTFETLMDDMIQHWLKIYE